MPHLSVHQIRIIELETHALGESPVKQTLSLVGYPYARLLVNDQPVDTLPIKLLQLLLGVDWCKVTDTFSVQHIKRELTEAIEQIHRGRHYVDLHVTLSSKYQADETYN